MSSLYDDLSEKIRKDPRLTKKSVSRFDLSLLLFNARDDLRDLWKAADRHARSHVGDDIKDLRGAVEKLRPIFGERNKP